MKYRFLFHLHTYNSYDASTKYNQLLRVIVQHRITHVAITEHNNIDSYRPFRELCEDANVPVEVIPAVEYTTVVGDVIVMGVDQLLTFVDPIDLCRKTKSLGGKVVLPHPYKRKQYDPSLIELLDFYEVLNMRGVGHSFDGEQFKSIKGIYGADAHTASELPGVINTFESDLPLFSALQDSVIIPEISNRSLKAHRTLTRIGSKWCKLRSKYLK